MTEGETGGDQALLSKWDAGDVDDVALSLPEDGIDLDAQREVEAYAERATSGGWELLTAGPDRVNWWNPDGSGTYWLERKAAGWHGVHGGRDVSPSYTDDLQEAIDAAARFLADHPVERDQCETEGSE